MMSDTKHMLLQPFRRFPLWVLALSVSGALATAQDSRSELSLTLNQATEMAVKNNLQTVLDRERITQAQGEKNVGRSYLLPNLSGAAYQANLTENLAALGLSGNTFPGLNPFVGPFSNFDARIRLTQSVFNLAAWRNYRAGKLGVELATEHDKFVTQQVITQAAYSYLMVQAQEQAVASAKANVQLAQSLLDLATSQRNAGVATGLDVARAETRLANQQVALAQAQTALETGQLELLRVIGAPLGSSLKLADAMKFTHEDLRDPSAAITAALGERTDLRAAEVQRKVADTQYQAALAGYAPSIAFAADYGSSAIKPLDTNLPTRTVAIRIDVPIFNGGRTHAETQVAASRQRQAEAQVKDLKQAIEKDVRQALDNLVTPRDPGEGCSNRPEPGQSRTGVVTGPLPQRRRRQHRSGQRPDCRRKCPPVAGHQHGSVQHCPPEPGFRDGSRTGLPAVKSFL